MMEEKMRASAREAGIYPIEKQTVKLEPIEADGYILDIGGGGEDIIDKLNDRLAIAIDKRIEELEETDNDSLKIVMDATDLKFLPTSFDMVTSFFILMYVENDLHPKVFKEVLRVLKESGRFLKWDVRIPRRFWDELGYGLTLEIVLPGEKVLTGYGTKWEDREQDLEYFKDLTTETGFKVLEKWDKDEIFFLELMKINTTL